MSLQGWGKVVSNLLTVYNIDPALICHNPLSHAKRFVKHQVINAALAEYKNDMDARIAKSHRDGPTWSRVYVHRNTFATKSFIGSFGKDLLLLMARIGDWLCALSLHRIGKRGDGNCPNCNEIKLTYNMTF